MEGTHKLHEVYLILVDIEANVNVSQLSESPCNHCDMLTAYIRTLIKRTSREQRATAHAGSKYARSRMELHGLRAKLLHALSRSEDRCAALHRMITVLRAENTKKDADIMRLVREQREQAESFEMLKCAHILLEFQGQ